MDIRYLRYYNSNSSILPGGYRYQYVLNNPLKYTDPSGYKKMDAYELQELREQEAAYADMMGIINEWNTSRYGSGGGGGGGVGGYTYHNGFYYYNGIPTSYWEVHAEVIIPNSKSVYTAPVVSSSSGSGGAGSESSAPGAESGATGEYAGSLIQSGPFKGLYMVQFYGFDQHFFFYNKGTGEFYAAYSTDVLNPIDVLTGKIDWYSSPGLPLLDFSSSISPWNTTINDPPIPHGNSIESWLIPLPPIFRGIKLARAARMATNVIPEGKLANHLFKGMNKLADTPSNRVLISRISNSRSIGMDPYGKVWYSGADASGNLIYTYTQNGIVKGAGYMNMTVEEMIIKYGLK